MKKRFAMLFAVATVLGTVPINVLAADSYYPTKVEEMSSPVSIETKSNQTILIGKRNEKISDILIKETKPGILKKNKCIYLQLKNLKFESGAKYEVISGDIKIRNVESDGDILKIEIENESSKYGSVIKISNLALSVSRNKPEGNYSLELITEEGGKYKNNTFGENYDENNTIGKFDTKSVTLIKNFVYASLSEKKADINLVYMPKTSFTVGKYEMIVGENKITIDEPAYISRGHVMVPVRALVENLSGGVTILWNNDLQAATIMVGSRIVGMKVGSNVMTVNGLDMGMVSTMEIKNDRVFIPLRDFGQACGISDSQIAWNHETKTVTLF